MKKVFGLMLILALAGLVSCSEEVVETPVVENNVTIETPVVEEPVVETPVVENNVTIETPVVEEPVVEAPVMEEDAMQKTAE